MSAKGRFQKFFEKILGAENIASLYPKASEANGGNQPYTERSPG